MRKSARQRLVAKVAAARPTKKELEINEFGGLDDKDDPTMEARIQASIDQLLQAQTRGDQTGWQHCGHKWPETSPAHQCR